MLVHIAFLCCGTACAAGAFLETLFTNKSQEFPKGDASARTLLIDVRDQSQLARERTSRSWQVLRCRLALLERTKFIHTSDIIN